MDKRIKTFAVIGLVLALLILILATIQLLTKKEPTLCAQDTMLCPDGTTVMRIAPDCEFQECPIQNQTDERNYCTEEQREAEACAEIYQPVCGWFGADIWCIAYPCADTYPNSCFACKDEKVDYWTAGECPPVNQQSLTGHWEGSLYILGSEIGAMVDFESSDNATIDIPLQGVKGLVLSNVSFNPPVVHFEIGDAGAVFEGKLSGSVISGSFKQSAVTGKFNLTKKEREVIVEEPVPYVQEGISFQNGDVHLEGTLTLPEGEGPFPAVVLISGSGAQNRDEEVFGFKIFRLIADNLTRAGIAVLRYDDRGVGNSTGDLFNSTSEDLAMDVLAAVEFLKNRSDIDPERIGLFGHSEGGIIAPIVASESDDVSFAVLMAGTALPGDEILEAQTELLLLAENATEEEVREQQALREKINTAARAGEGWEEVEEDIRRIIKDSIDDLPPEQRESITDVDGLIDSRVAPQLMLGKSPWYKFFIDYDPRPALRELKIPVLALFGELDLQVPAEMNRVEMEKALENKDATIVIFPKANHLFQEADTGGLSEYSILEKDFVPGFLDLVTGWILEHME
ncbi:MAG: alpha/beta fold hydrolase [Candidatus Altiarchaeota archaeon]|nr:alpha/beta fold hydrolase [Candidatus Altiarchaeota archaeon]